MSGILHIPLCTSPFWHLVHKTLSATVTQRVFYSYKFTERHFYYRAKTNLCNYISSNICILIDVNLNLQCGTFAYKASVTFRPLLNMFLRG